jgi:hypothetical protein
MSTSADKRMSISTCLDVEFDKVPFHLVTKGDSATISFNSISDAFSMFGKMRSAKFLNGSQLQEFENILSHMNLTVYLQNRHFGLFGPKAGFFIPKLARLFFAASKK